MRHDTRGFGRLTLRGGLLAAMTLVSCLAISVNSLEAHARQHRQRHRPPGYVHGHVHWSVVAPQAVFVVPHHMPAHHAVRYRSHYRGRAYCRAHGHFHELYSFPVFADGAWVYRPHEYCGERLQVEGDVSVVSPRFGFFVHF